MDHTRRSLLLAALLWPGAALAVDLDGDGWHRCVSPAIFDCDCADASGEDNIYPTATEIPENGIDEDCDRADGVNQKLWSAFDPLGTGWTTSGTQGTDTVILGAGKWVKWTGSRNIRFGPLVVVVDTATIPTGDSCTVSADWDYDSTSYSNSATLVEGTVAYTLNTTYADITLTEVKVSCDSGNSGVVPLDWLVLQNGTDTFPPAADIDLTWWDVDAPEGGYDNSMTVRGGVPADGLPYAYDTMYAVSDTGGVGEYLRLAKRWRVINGTYPNNLYHDQDLSAWDVAYLDDGSTQTLLAVTGVHVDQSPRTLYGQLFASTNNGDNWTREAHTWGDDDGSESIAVHRRVHYWYGSGDKDRPSGRLIEPAGEGSAFVASHTYDQTSGALPSLYLRDASGTLCAVDDTASPTLPTTVSAQGSDSFQNIVSALAWVPDEGHSNADSTLLVGYRQRDTSSSSGEYSLYRCNYGTKTPACTDTPDCVEISHSASEGIDVADLEVVEDATNGVQAYIADHGRRRASGGCIGTNPQSAAGDICGARVWRWDVDLSDSTGNSDSVSDITSGTNSDGLVLSVSGEMTPATGVTLGPDGNYLFAYTPTGRGNRYTSKPPIWRVELCEVDGFSSGCGTDGWLTMSEADDPTVTPYFVGESQRETYISGSTAGSGAGTWMGDQTSQSYWAAIWDGVFLEHSTSSHTLVGPNIYGFWGFEDSSVSTTNGGLLGSALDGHGGSTKDEDNEIAAVFYDVAGDSGVTSFQGAVTTDAAFGSDEEVWLTAMDLGYLYEASGSATKAEVPSQLHALGAGGRGVDVVPTVAGTADAVWIALYQQSTTSGVPPDKPTILRSDDSGASFCYQASADAGTKVDDSTKKWVDDHRENAMANDGDISDLTYVTFDSGDWQSCDTSGASSGHGLALREPSGSDYVSFGNPLDIVALDESVAVVAFQSYDFTEALDGSPTSGTQDIGLAYTLDGAKSWTAVDTTNLTCSGHSGFVEESFSKGVELELVPYNEINAEGSRYTSSSDWQLELFVLATGHNGALVDSSSATCSLWNLLIETTTSTTTTWTNIDIPDGTGATDCKVAEDATGIALAPWSERLMIWADYDIDTVGAKGGACMIDHDGSDPLLAIDPSTEEFDVGDIQPHPAVQDVWIVVPFVDYWTQRQCTATYSGGSWSYSYVDRFDGCTYPAPFLLRRKPLGMGGSADWFATDLPSDELPSLKGQHLDILSLLGGQDDAIDTQFLYGTTGSTAFRGVVAW